MDSNKSIRSLVVLFAITTLLLIVPASFALENNTANHEISTSEIEILKDTQNVFYVNASTGSGEGSGSADDPVSTISEGLKLAKDGGTLYLNGKFTDDDNFNLALENKTVTFIGTGNAVIDGNFTRTFAIAKTGNYRFENITFTNHYKEGNESYGGAFNNVNATVTFENCIFENNVVNGTNRANGGAVDNSGTMTIINSIFKNNTATVTNSSGYRKHAADGGAISNLGKVYIYNTKFIGNTALRNGGAIRTQDRSTTYIKGCNFTNNTAAYHMSGGSYGGAIYTWDCGLELYDSIFENNKIYDSSGYGARGGALSLNRGIGNIIIYSCQFINNHADGIATVDGQSIYFDSVEAIVSYFIIDTSIYSISQTVNLNFNWWVTDSKDIHTLIENLPSSAAIKKYAELVISSNADEIEVGKDIDVSVDLYWNGTKNQDNINMIPVKTITLDCVGGVLQDTVGTLAGGSFKTTFKPDVKDILIIVNVDGVSFRSNLSKEDRQIPINITCDDIFEGETLTISIETTSKVKTCFINLNNATYYLELVNGKGSVMVDGLNSGRHVANLKFYDSDLNLLNETEKAFTVKEKADLEMNITCKDVIVENEMLDIWVKLSENITGTLTAYLDGNEVAAITIHEGEANITLENLSAGAHAIEVGYAGDNVHNPASKAIAVFAYVPKKDTEIEVGNSFTFIASDTKAGESGGYLKATLKDVDGNPLANRTVQIALNGKVYNVDTDANGIASLEIALSSANTYTCALSFNGDDGYNASPLAVTKLTVSKKSTSLKASSKAFKAKAKTKTVSVTLKTSKNKSDGKTYLSKGKKITLNVKGKTFTAKTNAKGVAKIKIKLTRKGKYTATIKFAGDSTYKASSKTVKITIK